MTLMFGSVCSGIEAASVAWNPLGMRAAWLSEVDPFCNAVLVHRYPDVPNLGDITAEDFVERTRQHAPIDVLVGGTPCQAFSSAGKRGGLADPRGRLTPRFLQIAAEVRPRWVVWENVPGVLSDDGGRTFGAVLGALVQRGYGVAYRVLNSEHFGVPQRRRRVFVVGHLGDARLAEQVLFEQEGEGRDLAAGEGTGQEDAGISARSPGAVEAANVVVRNSGQGYWLADDKAATLGTQGRGLHESSLVIQVVPFDMRQASRGDRMTNNRREGAISGGAPGTGIGKAGDPSPSLALSHPPAVVYQCQPVYAFYHTGGSHGVAAMCDRSPAIKVGSTCGAGYPPAVAYQCQGTNVCEMGTSRSGNGHLTGDVPFLVAQEGDRRYVVRRLTPLEAERLQGLPDNYSLVPVKRSTIRQAVVREVCAHLSLLLGREVTPAEARQLATDSSRYRAVGNSFAVPAVRWIGRRLLAVNKRQYGQ